MPSELGALVGGGLSCPLVPLCPQLCSPRGPSVPASSGPGLPWGVLASDPHPSRLSDAPPTDARAASHPPLCCHSHRPCTHPHRTLFPLGTVGGSALGCPPLVASPAHHLLVCGQSAPVFSEARLRVRSEGVRAGSEPDQSEVREGSERGQSRVRERSEWGQSRVRVISEQGQSEVRARSERGQSEVRAGSERSQSGVRARSERGQSGSESGWPCRRWAR